LIRAFRVKPVGGSTALGSENGVHREGLEMKLNSIAKAFLGLTAAGVAYTFLVRPWHLRWGATDEELAMPLPGDDIKPEAGVSVTHAVTIDAPREHVWRWLVQIGQGRGGFFSYDFIENLFDLDIRNVYEIRPELQELKLGDFVRSAHEGWLGGRFDDKAGWFVVGLEPNHYLVLRDEIEHGSWVFVLNPVPENKTRLIIRARGDRPVGLVKWMLHHSVFEPAHFVMERKMMLTLKELAENGPRSNTELSSPSPREILIQA
jgi:hypothetical protein